METICADTFHDSLDHIAKLVSVQLEPDCIHGTLVDKDPDTVALDPDCQVMDRYVDDQKRTQESALPACAVDATPPCWTLVDDASCSGGKLLRVTRGPGSLPDTLHTAISCNTCIPGVDRAGCP